MADEPYQPYFLTEQDKTAMRRVALDALAETGPGTRPDYAVRLTVAKRFGRLVAALELEDPEGLLRYYELVPISIGKGIDIEEPKISWEECKKQPISYEQYSEQSFRHARIRSQFAAFRRRISALEKKAPLAVARLSKKLTMKEKHLRQAYDEIYRQRKYIKRLKERIERMKKVA